MAWQEIVFYLGCVSIRSTYSHISYWVLCLFNQTNRPISWLLIPWSSASPDQGSHLDILWGVDAPGCHILHSTPPPPSHPPTQNPVLHSLHIQYMAKVSSVIPRLQWLCPRVVHTLCRCHVICPLAICLPVAIPNATHLKHPNDKGDLAFQTPYFHQLHCESGLIHSRQKRGQDSYLSIRCQFIARHLFIQNHCECRHILTNVCSFSTETHYL